MVPPKHATVMDVPPLLLRELLLQEGIPVEVATVCIDAVVEPLSLRVFMMNSCCRGLGV